MREFDDTGEVLPQLPLPPSTRHRHLVTHDESTFNANDSTSHSWKKGKMEWLKPKSKGKGIIVSEFLCMMQERLHHINESWSVPEKIYATEIIKYNSGKSDDS